MKIFAIIAIIGAFVLSSADSSAQGSLAPAAQAPVILKPKFKFSNLKGAANFMGGIEIRGNEVDAYLDLRKVLTDAIEDATKAKKTDEDVITVELRADQLQNLAVLMQRGTLKGAEADAFKDIMTALNEAVKAAQPSGK
ncbi:MAG: hypothetical protein FGM33_09085 [Candidatus Kapabacteria bacterium]|nr:hypothetical protein [Candidatus Kapabacteria bacterium]